MKRTLLIIIALAALALSGCEQLKSLACSGGDEEVRALWVTRWDYKEPGDVMKIIENAEAMNFNMILFQVRGNGTAFYPSDVEPWAWELSSEDAATTGTDPGWDPMRMAIDLAHARGMELHAYMNLFPAWQSQDFPPESAGQMWTEHPDWFMSDAAGNKMIPRDGEVPYSDPIYGGPLANIGERTAPPRSWYSFVNPAHPEVQEHLASVFGEVAANYPDVDGIHFDYIRYPVEIREVREGHEGTVSAMGNWSYDPLSLEKFAEDTRVETPADDPEAWTTWRCQQITDTLTGIREAVDVSNPDIVFSAAVMANPTDAYNTKHQDYLTWMEMGLLDIAITMNYTSNNDTYREKCQMVIDGMDGGLFIPGMSFGNGAEKAEEQIAISRELGLQGWGAFAYSHLYDRDNGHVAKPMATELQAGALAESAKLPW